MAKPKKTEQPKLENIPETCASCRFFLLDEQKDEAGFCRRYPPVYVGSEEEGGWTHAVTWFDQYCGEFQGVKQ